MPTPSIDAGAGDWMRTFAFRLAQEHPELSANEAINLAINAYGMSPGLPPEIVVERCRANPPSASRVPAPSVARRAAWR